MTSQSSTVVYPLRDPFLMEAGTTYAIGVRDGEPYIEEWSAQRPLPENGRICKPFRDHTIRWIAASTAIKWWWACEAHPDPPEWH